MTHPFHPLYGQEFELVDRRNAWGEDRVYFLEHGELRRIPTSWTSVGAANPLVALSAGRAHFQVPDLLALASMIAGQMEVQPPVEGNQGRRRVSRK